MEFDPCEKDFDMDVQNDRKPKFLVKHLLNLQPADYSDILCFCSANFFDYRETILEAGKICIKQIPGNLMLLAFFIDLCAEKDEIRDQFKNIIHETSREIDNVFEFFVYILNLNFLEMYEFVKKDETASLLRRIGLENLTLIFTNLRCAEDIIQATRRVDEKGTELTLNEINLQHQNLKQEIQIFCDNFNDILKLSNSKSHDFLVGMLIFKQFNFDISTCCDALDLYYTRKYPEDQVLSILFALCYESIPKSFIYATFIRTVRNQGILLEFYEKASIILSEKNPRLMSHVRTILFLVFERFYKNQSDMDELYVKSFGYDPAYDSQTIDMFYSLLDKETLLYFNMYTPIVRLKSSLLEKILSYYNLKKRNGNFDISTNSNENSENTTKINNNQSLNEPKDFSHTFTNENSHKIDMNEFLKLFEDPPNMISETGFDLKHHLRNKNFDRIANENKNSLFLSFFEIGKPSPSHFLSFFETLRPLLFESDADKKLFLQLFVLHFSRKKSFFKVIIQKFHFYRIFDNDLLLDFPETADIISS